MDPPPPPNPSSLLWAHQIRREHIHLVHQIDTLRTDLAIATDTMNDLKDDIETLSRQVEDTGQGNARVQADLLRLEEQFNGRLQDMQERIHGLEMENGVLRGRVEGLERENVSSMTRTAAMERKKDERKKRKEKLSVRQPTVLRIACENGVFKRARTRASSNMDMDLDQGDIQMHKNTGSKIQLPDSEILAPDSMPVDESSPLPLLRPGDYVRSLSETTLTSSSPSSLVTANGKTMEGRVQTRSANPNSNSGGLGSGPGSGTRRAALTKEQRHRLTCRWAMADHEYSRRVHLKDAEEGRMEGFMQTLRDTEMRAFLEERCREAGCCSWDGLRTLVREIIREGEGERAMLSASGGLRDTTACNGKTGNPALKRKRYIPIVPPDREEQLVIDAYGRGWIGAS